MIVSGAIRVMMTKFVHNVVPSMSVLAYQEIPEDKQITVIATIGNG